MKSILIANVTLYFLMCFLPAHPQQVSVDQWQEDLKYLQATIHQKYPNLFYNITSHQFDSAVAVLANDIPALTQTEIEVGFVKLLAMFKIGHTGLYFKSGIDEGKPLFHYYPFSLYPFSDGLYVRSIPKKYASMLGAKITRIGNLETQAALKKMREVISYENDQNFKNNVMYFLRLPEILFALKISPDSTSVTLTCERNGVQEEIKVESEIAPEEFWHSETQLPPGWVDVEADINNPGAPLWLKNPDATRYFEYKKEFKTVYVRHSAVQDELDETIEEYFRKVFEFVEKNEVEKFVLDIRLNAGGNLYLNKPVVTGIIQSKKINRYGHLFVIIGAGTFSAAQNLTNALEKYTEVIFVGEPTGENVNYYGDVKTEILPNSKLTAKLSWLWWQDMDPRDKRIWTAPDLAVDMSFSDYASGVDPAMDVILSHRDNKKIANRLIETVLRGKVDSANFIGRNYISDPLHRFCKDRLEEEINDAAILLVMRGKIKDGGDLLRFNTTLFPGSGHAYEMLAEYFYFIGEKDEAIKYYTIAISRDPNGPIGDNSRKMVASIKSEK